MPSQPNQPREIHTEVLAARNDLRKWAVQLRRRWWVVPLIVAACIFVGTISAYRQPPAFLSTAQMVVGGKIVVPGGASYSEELTYFMGTQAALMKSPEVQRRAAQRLASTQPDLPRGTVTLNVLPQPNTSIFNLSAVGSNPAYTQQFLSAVMTEYSAIKREMRSKISDNTQAAITKELKRLNPRLPRVRRSCSTSRRTITSASFRSRATAPPNTSWR